MENLTPQITKREREIAIRVLMQSKIVMNWVRAEAAFFNIKPGTSEWSKFFRENSRKAALRIIQR